MPRVLVLFAHPALEKSRVHRRLVERVRGPRRRDVPRPLRGLPRLRRGREAGAGPSPRPRRRRPAAPVLLVLHARAGEAVGGPRARARLGLRDGGHGAAGQAPRLRGHHRGRRGGLPRGGPQPLHRPRAARADRADGAPVRHGLPAALRRPRHAPARRGRHRAARPTSTAASWPPCATTGWTSRRRGSCRASTPTSTGCCGRSRSRAEAAMHGEGFFFQAFVYLTAAVVSVPIAKRLGLGSVLGYLLAGVAIGPFGLAPRGRGGPGRHALRRVRRGDDALPRRPRARADAALAAAGPDPRPRRPAGGRDHGRGGRRSPSPLGLAWPRGRSPSASSCRMSSTAIVLQSLAEKGLLKTAAGQSSFAVLLFQDLAVIPILALFPLLGRRAAAHATAGPPTRRPGWAACPAWGQTLACWPWSARSCSAARFLLRPVFRAIAATRLRELFTAAALLLVIGIALLMTRVGLSPALGHLPRRRRPRQQRVPPRAGERRRAVQGPAARPLLHRRGGLDRLRPRGRAAGRGSPASWSRRPRGEGRRPLRPRPGLPPRHRPGPAPSPSPSRRSGSSPSCCSRSPLQQARARAGDDRAPRGRGGPDHGRDARC